MNTVNTESVITSCITFSCHKENGPPLSTKPILFAGTWNMYSKKAIPQLIRMIRKRPALGSQFISFILRWPYQANVIKVLLQISNTMVRIIFFIKKFFLLLVILLNKFIYCLCFIQCKISNPCTAQTSEISANTQCFSKIVCQTSYIRARCAYHPENNFRQSNLSYFKFFYKYFSWFQLYF